MNLIKFYKKIINKQKTSDLTNDIDLISKIYIFPKTIRFTKLKALNEILTFEAHLHLILEQAKASHNDPSHSMKNQHLSGLKTNWKPGKSQSTPIPWSGFQNQPFAYIVKEEENALHTENQSVLVLFIDFIQKQSRENIIFFPTNPTNKSQQ